MTLVLALILAVASPWCGTAELPWTAEGGWTHGNDRDCDCRYDLRDVAFAFADEESVQCDAPAPDWGNHALTDDLRLEEMTGPAETCCVLYPHGTAFGIAYDPAGLRGGR